MKLCLKIIFLYGTRNVFDLDPASQGFFPVFEHNGMASYAHLLLGKVQGKDELN